MRFKTTLLCSALTLATSLATGAIAQSAQGGGASTIEEVVVTARKREESLQSIPVAVSAISGENLARQGLRQPSDLTRAVPSLTIADAPASGGPSAALISLRGQVASDTQLAFSQPVGLYEDSVNIPHPVGANIAFFDLQRVEVLKGPQGTLYGRNTTGGAINLITRGADYSGVHGFAYGEVGDYKDWKLAGAVNLPVVADKLAVRLAYQHWNRQGFGQSATTGQHIGGDRDDDIARMSLKVDPTQTVTATLKAEYFRADRSQALFQLRQLSGALGPLALPEFLSENNQAGRPTPAQQVDYMRNSGDRFTNFDETRVREKVKGYHLVADVSWDITDDVRLRSISGLHWFKQFNTSDLDTMSIQLNETGGVGSVPIAQGTVPAFLVSALSGGLANFPVPSAGVDRRPEQPSEVDRTASQEFNLSGRAFDNHLSWLTGFFYSSDSGRGTEIASVAPVLFTFIDRHPLLLADTEELSNLIESWGVFTQNDFKFNDVFSITAGLRYSEEHLKGLVGAATYDLSPGTVQARYSCSAGPNAPSPTNPTPAPVPTAVACAVPQSAKFSGTSYLLSFNFQFTPETLVYAKTARGFRGGALPIRNPTFPVARPEIATDYEVGLKTDLFDRRLRANLAAYQTNYDNKQESTIITLNNSPSTVVTNAATARLRGFEGEFTAAPIENLTLSASVTYLNGVYLSYPGAPDPNNSTSTFNASGERFSNPRWSYNVGGRYVAKGLGPGDLGFSANYYWHSHIPLTRLNTSSAADLALYKEWYSSVGLLNASIDYNIPEMGLTLAVFSTNALNKHYQTLGLPGLPFGVLGATQEPRMVGVSVRKTFGQE